MTFDAYRGVLRITAARRLLLVTMIARLPNTAAGMVLTLHVVETLGRSYADAGLVAATFTLGIALGGPWRGRLLDRVGVRWTLVPSIVAQAVVWPLAAAVDYAWLFPVVLVAGLFGMPVFTLVRKSLAAIVPVTQLRSAFALDAIGTETMFMIGPAAGILAAAHAGTPVVLTAIGVGVAAAGLLLWWYDPPTTLVEPAAQPAVEPDQTITPAKLPMEAARPGTRRWLTPAVGLLLVGGAAAELALAGTDVGILAVLRERGEIGALSVVYIAWCAGSVAGGLVYGAVHRAIDAMVLLVALGALTIPMVLGGTVVSLTLLAAMAGLACAPVLTAMTEAITRLVPPDHRGEAAGWQGSMYTVGMALGSPLCGVVIDRVAPWASFVVAGAVAVVVGGVGIVGMRLAGRRRAVPSYAAEPV